MIHYTFVHIVSHINPVRILTLQGLRISVPSRLHLSATSHLSVWVTLSVCPSHPPRSDHFIHIRWTTQIIGFFTSPFPPSTYFLRNSGSNNAPPPDSLKLVLPFMWEVDHDGSVGIVTNYGLVGSVFRSRYRRDCPLPSNWAQSPLRLQYDSEVHPWG